MSVTDRERWNAKYAVKTVPERLAPDEWLMEQVVALRPGRALDLACGIGHNAIWLAQQGWQVDAVDISPVGLSLAAGLADSCGACVNWIAADLDEYSPLVETYDLICVFRFLDRGRLPKGIQAALRPGGQLIYEAFSSEHLSRQDSRMKNPAYALEPGELPQLFPLLEVISNVDVHLADRTVTQYIGKRHPARTNVVEP